jgi:hypothetical protein
LTPFVAGESAVLRFQSRSMTTQSGGAEMKVLTGARAPLQPAQQASVERKAMAMIGVVFGFAAVAALAVALVLEGPATEAVLPEAAPAAPAAAASPR